MADATPEIATDAAAPAKKRPRVLRRILIVAGSVIGVLVIAVAAMLTSFVVAGWQSEREQLDRFAARSAEVAALSQADRDAWVETSGDPTVTDELAYNELQVIATHNSYALPPTWLQTQVIDLVEPGQGAALQYSHAPLWDQLDEGIRSMEIDVRWNGEAFSVSHVPLVANRSTMPDFALGLREIALWSDAHPAHLPISIMIEAKNDYMFLDPALKAFDAGACDALDAVIVDAMGSRLFAPADVLGDAPNLRAAVADGGAGWPSGGDMRGRVLFFYADSEGTREACSKGAVEASDRAVFASSRTGVDSAVFAVRDDPRDAATAADLAAGMIVRVRADADLATSAAERDLALATGAQIVSTDFPPSEPQAGTGYFVEFPGGALARAGR